MLTKLSPRQKARGAISLLNLSDGERQSLDSIVADTMGNPIVGAIAGVDAITLEELVTNFFNAPVEETLQSEMVGTLRDKLTNPKVRTAVSKGIVRALDGLSPENQANALSVITRVSRMDFPEFDKDFADIEDFISNGLLVLVAQKNEVTKEADIIICENCSHAMSI